MKTQCPLCGTRFDTDESQACKSCPFFMKCDMIQCPNCGHEFPKN
ncbi:MAG: hypothetical protein O8C66_05000 [Candidatus Methanoperedens sp.]|nr:hypothetical protein [Candidatus Methanoperedens sp.]MCZ7369847.1 hypothetical protein [Candidatus Methanoperedens sp.]